jgi:hypothetical protein
MNRLKNKSSRIFLIKTVWDNLNSMEIMRKLKENYLKIIKTRKVMCIQKNFYWIAILWMLATAFVPVIDRHIPNLKTNIIYQFILPYKSCPKILFLIKLKRLTAKNKKSSKKKFWTQIKFTWITAQKYNLFKIIIKKLKKVNNRIVSVLPRL